MMTMTTTKQRRKPTAKPRDASTPHGSTAAESVRTLLKQNARYSKRINYDALKDLFTDEKEEEEGSMLYTIDDKEIVEEGGGRIGGHTGLIDTGGLQADPDDVDDADGSDKGDDYGGWEDTYEQEV
jgi:transcription factor IIIB subunit 2